MKKKLNNNILWPLLYVGNTVLLTYLVIAQAEPTSQMTFKRGKIKWQQNGI